MITGFARLTDGSQVTIAGAAEAADPAGTRPPAARPRDGARRPRSDAAPGTTPAAR